jgi:ferredoxin
MLRKIVNIDEELCDGCGLCVPECHEGALQIIDGKARLISDLFCDGLGACLGQCPQGAITIDVREAEPYDELKVMDYIIKGGPNVIKAHLKHLIDHNEMEYYRQAVDYLQLHAIEYELTSVRSNEQDEKKQLSKNVNPHQQYACGCPGSKEIQLNSRDNLNEEYQTKSKSHLTQWPVQFHLISPNASYFRNADLLLTADCVPFAYPDYHKDFLQGKSLAVACPKLDTNQRAYLDKLVVMIREAELKSITVLVMQVPCCSGLYQLAQRAIEESEIDIPLKVIVIGINGEILKEIQIS